MPVIDIEPGEGEIVVPGLANHNFSLSIEEVPVQTAGEYVANIIDDDGNLEQFTSAVIRYDAQVILNIINAGPLFRSWFTSGDIALATVDAHTGYVTATGTGNVKIYGNTAFLSRRVNHFARTEGGVASNAVFTTYVSGSLGESLFDAVIDILDGTESREKNLFTTVNHGTSTYVRNTNVWTGNIDWTGVEVYNSTSGGNQRGGALVSPRHMIMANHFPIGNGATLRFVDNDNNVVTREMSNSVQIAGTDIRVGLLNADVPGEIVFYKVFPADWNDYLKYRENIGIIVSDQENKALVRDWKTTKTYNGQSVIHVFPNTSPKDEVAENLISGDSSSPAFAVLDGEMIALGTHFTASTFPFLSFYHSQINAAMTTLGGGYSLTDVDLSAFPTYP